ncbi:YitT family protein [Stakelama tenebrarum]|uniref:YitT family protein n=1 Tax=Stakelama tenebrarum TaxID=2711215 RepID=A0A6G6Y552_9SPHN|nr:YitT family protein [Sphingosinithalassobacter tenebrarum]QIG80045.1 YitT family protein [Sphingosinithalassobacter tenebrarum]
MQPRAEAQALPLAVNRHSIAEDAYALITGAVLISLGLVFLQNAGLVTGGVAGVALIFSYLIPLPVGVLLVLLNLPFLFFARTAMGLRFAIKTLLVNIGIAVFSLAWRFGFDVAQVQPWFAALVGGTVIGLGILALARHGAGVGGVGVITLWLHNSRGINAGRAQIAIDIVVLLAALFIVNWTQFAWSALSAAAISTVLMVWHRPGRYTGY